MNMLPDVHMDIEATFNAKNGSVDCSVPDFENLCARSKARRSSLRSHSCSMPRLSPWDFAADTSRADAFRDYRESLRRQGHDSLTKRPLHLCGILRLHLFILRRYTRSRCSQDNDSMGSHINAMMVLQGDICLARHPDTVYLHVRSTQGTEVQTEEAREDINAMMVLRRGICTVRHPDVGYNCVQRIRLVQMRLRESHEDLSMQEQKAYDEMRRGNVAMANYENQQ